MAGVYCYAPPEIQFQPDPISLARRGCTGFCVAAACWSLQGDDAAPLKMRGAKSEIPNKSQGSKHPRCKTAIHLGLYPYRSAQSAAVWAWAPILILGGRLGRRPCPSHRTHRLGLEPRWPWRAPGAGWSVAAARRKPSIELCPTIRPPAGVRPNLKAIHLCGVGASAVDRGYGAHSGNDQDR